METLTVFTVAYNTPYERLAQYQTPADMPPCPDAGCICVWGWAANGCGEPNIYFHPYRCKIANATSKKVVGKAQVAQWCLEDPTQCVAGPKQLIIYNEATGNNYNGYSTHGPPGYNMKMGFHDGAQNDIFVDGTGSSLSPANSSNHNATQSPATGNPNATLNDPLTPPSQSSNPPNAGTFQTNPGTVPGLSSSTHPKQFLYKGAQNLFIRLFIIFLDCYFVY